jgi:hypothetical protein
MKSPRFLLNGLVTKAVIGWCAVALSILGCSSSQTSGDSTKGASSNGSSNGKSCSASITGNSNRYDGFCYKTVNCAWDEACTDGKCTKKCQKAGDCQRMRGCVNGSCGKCTLDSHCGTNEKCINAYCMQSPIEVWQLTVNATDWQNLYSDARYQKQEVPCSLSVEGVNYPNCTVRPRGQSSLDYAKLPLRIEFPEDVDNPGYSRNINIRSEYNDRSFLHNVLANETFRYLTQIPTPRTKFIRLLVNGIDYGLNVEYEAMGGKFLERFRRSRDVSTYEADPETDALFYSGVSSLVPLPSADMYPKGYQKKTGDETKYGDLQSLIETTIAPDYKDKTSCRVREKVNLELYLDYLATLILVQNMDHIWKNFYLSLQKDETGKERWEFYPWDLDLTFGCLWTEEHDVYCEDSTWTTEYTWGKFADGQSAVYPLSMDDVMGNPLVTIVLNDPVLKANLSKRICTFIDSDFWTKEIYQLIDAYAETILPDVITDTRDRNGQPDAGGEAVAQTSFQAEIAKIKEFIPKRADYLRNQLLCTH